jgi:hypothetical protein
MAGVDVSEEDILDLSSHTSVEEVQELTLRNMKLTTFSKHCERLVSLRALSLSHNLLTNLQSFKCLQNLISLNLNFNSLPSLSGLETLENIQHLYVANNSVRSIDPLRGCTSLRTLSMFKNTISNLDTAVDVLAALPHLKDLEMGMNPCAQVPEYKPRLVFDLVLEVLDGDPLTELDRQLAMDYMSATGGGPEMHDVQGSQPSPPHEGKISSVVHCGSITVSTHILF